MNEPSNTPLVKAARVAAWLCAILFVITALNALLVFNVERRAFNASTYKSALTESGFYAKFPSLLGDLIKQNIGSKTTSFIEQMSSADWTNLISSLLPQEKLQRMTEEAITQVFDYINGVTREPHLTLTPIKQGLAGPAGVDAVMTIFHSQPPCTVAQVALMLGSFGQVLCDPPQEILDLARPLIKAQLVAASSALPDQIPLMGPETSATHLRDLKNLRLLMRLSPLVPLAFLLLITILVVRSLREWLTWWGWPLTAAGLLGALSGFGGAPLFRGSMERFLASRIPVTLPQDMAASIREIADIALREMLKPAGWEGLGLFVLGLAMLGAAYFLGRKEQSDRLARSEATTQVFR